MTTRFSADQLTRFARTVVDAVHTPFVVVDSSLVIRAANTAFAGLVGDERLDGRPLLELARGRFDQAPLRMALEQLLPERRSFDDIEVAATDGSTLFVSGRALPTAGDDELIVLAFDSAGAAERTGNAAGAEPLYEIIFDTVREPMLALSYGHEVQLANSAFYKTFRVSAEEVLGKKLSELGNGQWHIPELRNALGEVFSGDAAFADLQVEHDFPEIGHKIMLLNGRRIDHLKLLLLAFEDVTDRHRQTRLKEAHVSELAHSIKNMFAVVQSLAYQTAAPTVEAYKEAFLGRVKALATSQGVLLEGNWQSADLRRLLTNVLKSCEDRAQLVGPEVALSREQATAMGLIVNELVTNAFKYGALSNERGHVQVTWEVDDQGLHLTWREEGGPPLQGEVTGEGLGTKLIARLVQEQLRGRLERTRDPAGLICRINIPLPG